MTLNTTENITCCISQKKEKPASKSKKKTSTKLIAREIVAPVAPPNVILHLKCSLKDLEQYNNERNRIVKDPLKYNPEIPPEIKAYEEPSVFSSALAGSLFVPSNTETTDLNFHKTDSSQPAASFGLAYPYHTCHKCREPIDTPTSNTVTTTTTEPPIIDTQKTQWKIKELKIKFHTNDLDTAKKSACLWCSYDFDNDPFYLPKQETPDHFLVYGCFCTPECATGYLFKERIDDTAKFERFHLLNKMYFSSCSNNENIHPAPNPYFLLERYLGNLTIEEYRDLLKKGRTFEIIEKPLSRVLPELHSDMNTGAGNVYKVKRSNHTTTAVS